MPVAFPAAWDPDWAGYELHEISKGHSPRSVSTRRASVLCLARRFPGRSPESLTKRELVTHFAAIRRYQKLGGVAAAYNDIRAFYTWLASDAEIPNPMLAIPRPKAPMPDVPVLSPGQIAGLLAACKGRDRAGRA